MQGNLFPYIGKIDCLLAIGKGGWITKSENGGTNE